ncbi:MAG: glycosyltransferase, partial [Pyrinomonadaceae bacterium]
DTVVHTFISALHAAGQRAGQRFDAALICNAANAIFAPILRSVGTPVVLNVDGLERKRKKWNIAGRAYYLLSERLSTLLPNEIVTDAQVIQDYYLSRYKKASTMIAYGADVERKIDQEAIAPWKVSPQEYFLYVSRLEPENNAHLVIEAFKKTRTRYKLIIVGDAPYAVEYKKRLQDLAAEDERIVLTGFVFGDGYRALQQNAYCYIHATEVGGTHPALIEALGFGNCVLTLETPENIEVVSDAALSYKDKQELSTLIEEVTRNEELVKHYRQRAVARVREEYDWDKITDKYEALFRKMLF